MVEMMMSLVGMMAVVMEMIIESREEVVHNSGFLLYPTRSWKAIPIKNTFNATFTPSMHLIVTS